MRIAQTDWEGPVAHLAATPFWHDRRGWQAERLPYNGWLSLAKSVPYLPGDDRTRRGYEMIDRPNVSWSL